MNLSYVGGGQVDILSLYKKYGYEVSNDEDMEKLGRMQRIFGYIRASMLPFINEFTADVVPDKQHTGIMTMMVMLKSSRDLSDLSSKLKERRRTLPVNGVMIVFDDPTESLKTLLIKETVFNDTVFLLYKLSTDEGDMSGYYDTRNDYFFSASIESANENFHQLIRDMVLFCYAANVLNDEEYTKEKFKETFANFIYPIGIDFYVKTGMLENVLGVYHHQYTRKIGDNLYDESQLSVNGYIRRLPKGQVASDEAQARAALLGYKLEPNETYVSPYTKIVFIFRPDGYNNQ